MTAKSTSFHLVAIPNSKMPDTKLNNFKIRTPENINLNQPYEVALIESSFPYNIYNIAPDAYLCITRYTLKSKIIFRANEQYRQHIIYGSRGEYALDYAIRLKIPEGFYSSIEQFKHVIKLKINMLLSNNNNELPVYEHIIEPGSTILEGKKTVGISYTSILQSDYYREASKKTSDYYQEAIAGLNRNALEFFIGLRLGKNIIDGYNSKSGSEKQVDALNNLLILDRIRQVPETGYLEFANDSALNAHDYFTVLRTDESTSTLLGFDNSIITVPITGLGSPYQVQIHPHDVIFLYLNILENVIVSDYECNLLRILPVAAMKPTFGELVWTEYLNPQYISVNSKHISYLHFELFDVQGKPVKFQHSAHNVQLTLHFRPIKHTGA